MEIKEILRDKLLEALEASSRNEARDANLAISEAIAMMDAHVPAS